MHKRESIIRNTKSALEAVVNVGAPIAQLGNSTPPASLVVQSGGDYSAVTGTRYQVTISTSGKSGVARCTIEDLDGSDDVAGATTITSGAPIALGANGGTITFTFGADDSMTTGDSWIIQCGPFNHTIKEVRRYRAAGVKLSSYPSIIIAGSSQDYDGDPESSKYSNRMQIHAQIWAMEMSEKSMDELLNELLEDFERAISADPQRGGYAQDTKIVRCDPGTPIEGQPYGVLDIDIEVTFNQVLN